MLRFFCVAFVAVMAGLSAFAQAEDKVQTLDATVVPPKQDAQPAAATTTATITAETSKTTGGSESTVCTSGQNKRLVETNDIDGTCEVHYKKETEQPGHDQLIWAAKNKKGLCIEKAQAFLEKLKAWGWSCAKA